MVTEPFGADVTTGVMPTPVESRITALAQAVANTSSQPVDSDLTAIAALTTTSYGRAFLALADAAAGRTALGLGTAATQATSAFDAAGAAAAAQSASQPVDSDLTAIAALTTTSFGRAFLTLADAAAARTAIGLGDASTHPASDFATPASVSSAVSTAINALTTGASGLLDTLAEIDAAIGNDPNYATTVTTALGTKVNSSTYTSGQATQDTAIAGKAPALVRTAVKNGSYTAAAGDLVPVDTTSGAVTVTLPTTPATGTRVAVKHIIQGGTNAVTIAAGGSDVFNKAGGSTSITLALVNQSVQVQYDSGIWSVVAGDLPLSQLDLRYAAFGSGGASGPSVVQSVLYTGSLSTTRPTADVVIWQGFPSQPTNYTGNDLYLDPSFAAQLYVSTSAPTSADGTDGDGWLRTGASAMIYGPKASGAWPAGTSLIGAAGSNGTNGRGVTTIARTSGTGAPGTTDTYTITYSDTTTSTFAVYNGADGAAGGGAALTVQDEGSNLATSATTINFVGTGVTATGTGATKTITIPGATSSALTPTAQTNTYTAAANDLVLASASGGAFTVTLPTPTAGVRIGVKKTDSSTNAVTVATTSGNIDGSATRTLAVQWQAQVFVADGTNWQRIDVPGVTALAATGTPSSTTYLRGDGSWSTPATGGTTAGGEIPDNVIATTIPRYSTTTAAAVGSSGQLKLSLIRLTAGQTVTSIRIIAGSTAGASLTHALAGLYDATQSGPVLLATSADDTTATWTANTSRTFTMGTPYTVPTTGWYYVGFMVAGTTIPTIFLQSALAGTAVNASPPVAAAVTNSGVTTALPATSSSATSGVNAQRFYAEIL